ncbi:MAG TPA: maltotransferase domain-containing protein, partial [Candidatus Limnocylindria bacterium]|nr:maltotransferase domain-containing protein [Candidatus Limnocylindria bacterium]
MQKPSTILHEGRCRVVIEGVAPEIDGGLFPIKRTPGEPVAVEADIFGDGHESIACVLMYRRDQEQTWREATMASLVNDRWRGVFTPSEVGRYVYTLAAWVDGFQTWRRDLQKRAEAGAHTDLDMLIGARLIEEAGLRAAAADARQLGEWAKKLTAKNRGLAEKLALALSEDLAGLMQKYPDRSLATTYAKELTAVVDRDKARFSSWYEMFPRSAATKPGAHGTFKD